LKTNFFNEVHDFQSFILNNIYLVGRYEIVSQQTTISGNETGIVDILAIDKEKNQLTVIELKNTSTSDKSIWQPIRYFDLISRGEESIKSMLQSFGFNTDTLNLEPKLVLVVPQHNEQLLRALSYFENIDISVVVISKSIINNVVDIKKQTFFPKKIVHKDDITEINGDKYKVWNIDEYEKIGVNKDKLNLIKRIVDDFNFLFTKEKINIHFFYSKSKITIVRDEKVFGYIHVTKNKHHHHVFLSIKNNGTIKKQDIAYEDGIESVDLGKKHVKITTYQKLSFSIIKKMM